MVMTEIGLYIAAALFAIGLFVIIAKRNLIFVLIGAELILNAANLNLVVFSRQTGDGAGQVFALFTIVIAAAEIGVALALLLHIVKYFKASDLDKLNQLGH